MRNDVFPCQSHIACCTFIVFDYFLELLHRDPKQFQVPENTSCRGKRGALQLSGVGFHGQE